MSTFSWTLPAAPDTGAVAAQNELNQRFYGTDIRMENDYFITSSGDYATIEGLEALKQAIYRRLLTRPGEYKFVPDYGVGVQTYVKQRLTTTTINNLKNAIRTNLLRDVRISAINQIDVEITESTLKLGLKITALGEALFYLPYQIPVT